MKRILLIFTLLLSIFFAGAQDFFNSEFNRHKKYIAVTNPTVTNIKKIHYLINAKLLNIKSNKTKFIGIYHTSQQYDFEKTAVYIKENELNNFYLYEVNRSLKEEDIFHENACTPEFNKIFNHTIGIFFFGGPDIPPSVYGESNSLSVVTDPGRHYFETSFLYHLLGNDNNFSQLPLLYKKPQYLVTGFCLGMQTMNVATGGTLIQDIPAELFGAKTPAARVKIGRKNMHRNDWQNLTNDSLIMGINLHTIQFTDHPFFGEIINLPKQMEPRIYSSHHQAVEDLGLGFQVTALSPDGKVIEGIAHTNYPNVFAVQFHPEVPALYEDMQECKFHPDDTPSTYHQMIGKKSVRFHEKYWEHISDILRKAPKPVKK